MPDLAGLTPIDAPMHESKCPSCGARIAFPDGAQTISCGSCGSSYRINYKPKPAQAAPQPAREPQRATTLVEAVVRDQASRYGIFSLKAPADWKLAATALSQTGSASQPYFAYATFAGPDAGIIRIQTGDGGTRSSAAMKAAMAMYGSAIAGVDRVNYADMPEPIALADSFMMHCLNGVGVQDLRPTAELDVGSIPALLDEAMARNKRLAQAQGVPPLFGSPYAASVARIYAFIMGGSEWRAASYVCMDAVKEGGGLGGDQIAAVAGNIASMIGGAFGSAASSTAQASQSGLKGMLEFGMNGGLLGKMRRDRDATANAPQKEQVPQPQPVAQQAPASSWCSAAYADYMKSGTIFWAVNTLASIVAPADVFEAQFRECFLPMVASARMHEDLFGLTLTDIQRYAAQVQQATNGALAQQQQMFQAQQAAHRQQQAAFDSYNASISAARDAHHQAFRASTNAQFDDTHHAPDFSEAIRGVNTFTRSDGSEVELSVHADVAFENQAGDVVGGSQGFDPGADWTQIPKQ